MKTKEEIVENWLPRYTGANLDQFGKYILLTNFSKRPTLLNTLPKRSSFVPIT
jgi:hypothetical protein